MSTPAVVIIYGRSVHHGDEMHRLFRDRDGYPTHVLKELCTVIKKVNKFDVSSSLTNTAAGVLVGISTTEYGMAYQLETEYNPFNPDKHVKGLNVQRWMYILDWDNKTLSIYGDSYDDGLVDPYNYLTYLRPECKAKTKRQITQQLKTIRAQGWQINPQPNSIKFIKGLVEKSHPGEMVDPLP